MIIGKAPLRLSFAGGGTDFEEYHNNHVGYTIGFTINKFTYVILRQRKDKKFQGFSPDFNSYHPPKSYFKTKQLAGHEIVLSCAKALHFNDGVDMSFFSDVEPGSGLGASSSLTANIVNVFLKQKKEIWDKKKIAMKAYEIGRDVLKWNKGKQDEFATIYGGLNFFKYYKKKVDVEPLSLNKSSMNELQENSLLLYMGHRTTSSHDILGSQAVMIRKGHRLTLNALRKAGELALDVRDALKQNNLTTFGNLIRKGWEAKKNIAKDITNKKINAVCNMAFSKGALGFKIVGAGGGGHLYVYAEKSNHKKIEANLKKFNVKKVNFNYSFGGATTIDVSSL